MGAKPEEEQAFTGDQALALLAQTVDPVEARRNPIDGAVVLAAMDAELEELEKAVAKQKEDQALLQQKKARGPILDFYHLAGPRSSSTGPPR